MATIFKGWNSHARGGSPGKFESSNLSRDNLGRETARSFHYGGFPDSLHTKGEHIGKT